MSDARTGKPALVTAVDDIAKKFAKRIADGIMDRFSCVTNAEVGRDTFVSLCFNNNSDTRHQTHTVCHFRSHMFNVF